MRLTGMGVGASWPHSHRANMELRSVPSSLCSHHTLVQCCSSGGFREDVLVTHSWRAEKVVVEGASGKDLREEPKGETSLQGLLRAPCSSLASSAMGLLPSSSWLSPGLWLPSLTELRPYSPGGGVGQALPRLMDLSFFPLASPLSWPQGQDPFF